MNEAEAIQNLQQFCESDDEDSNFSPFDDEDNNNSGYEDENLLFQYGVPTYDDLKAYCNRRKAKEVIRASSTLSTITTPSTTEQQQLSSQSQPNVQRSDYVTSKSKKQRGNITAQSQHPMLSLPTGLNRRLKRQQITSTVPNQKKAKHNSPLQINTTNLPPSHCNKIWLRNPPTSTLSQPPSTLQLSANVARIQELKRQILESKRELELLEQLDALQLSTSTLQINPSQQLTTSAPTTNIKTLKKARRQARKKAQRAATVQKPTQPSSVISSSASSLTTSCTRTTNSLQITITIPQNQDQNR